MLMLCLANTVFAQEPLSSQPPQWEGYYGAPLRFDTLTLSGNVGEFRSNHFHGGLDFRVGGVSGAPVCAVADGYISRITVSSNGYGNGLYVTHPNGTVSVYGHLASFKADVAAFVLKSQYEQTSFFVDLEPTPIQFPVTKGQLIGRAGNTGDSAGPHLHFEIRYTDSVQASQYVTNLLDYKVFSFKDELPPEFRRIQLYGYTTQADGTALTSFVKEIPLAKTGTTQAPVAVPDTFYVAMDAIDRMNGTHARLGIQRWEVSLDDSLVYAFDNKDYDMRYTRYINSLIQYSERVRKGRSLLKTWLEPGNKLRDRIFAPSEGLFALPDTLPHTLALCVKDAAGNRATRSFLVCKASPSAHASPSATSQQAPSALAADSTVELYTQLMYWDRDNFFAARDICVFVPQGALYRNIPFYVMRPTESEWIVYNNEDPLHTAIIIQLPVPDSLMAVADKVLLMSQTKGQWNAVGGQVANGILSAQTTSFGRFKIGTDTLAPSVTATFKDKADLRGRKSIGFTLVDKGSGIDSYTASIDGQWYLFSMNSGRNRITAFLDSSHLKKGTTHTVEVVVTDRKQNTTTYQTSFIW